MIELLQTGKRIINLDESLISEMEYSRRYWEDSSRPATVSDKGLNLRLALITVLDSDGGIWFALSHANTDSDIILLFLSGLCMHLDLEYSDWRENSVILLDGAKYHTSSETRKTL